MRERLLQALNIEENELLPVIIFIIQSIFFGVFYGAFDISSQTIFIEVFPASDVAIAYLVSGLFGIVLTALFSRLQTKIRFSNLTLISLTGISILIVALRFGFYYFPNTKALAFISIVMYGPLRIIGILIFWGTVSRMFTLRQGKRLFGMIDVGQAVGIIFVSFTIPIFLNLFLTTIDILWICGVSIIIALGFQIYLLGRYKLKKQIVGTASQIDGGAETESYNLGELLRDRYIKVMSAFIILSVVSLFFIQYTFYTVSVTRYPDSEDFGKFLSWVTGTMWIFIIIMKTFVFNKLVKTYGLKISLALSPVILIIFTAGAVLIATSFGFTIEDEGFVLFFLIIALSRLFSVILKESFEVPSFKILYQSIDSKTRYDVQAKIDGTVNEIAAVLGGGILAIIRIFTDFTLLEHAYILLAIVIIWGIISLETHKEYHKSLKKSLKAFQTRIKQIQKKERKQKTFSQRGEINVQQLNLLENNDPRAYYLSLVELSENLERMPDDLLIKIKREHLIYPTKRNIIDNDRLVTLRSEIKEVYYNVASKSDTISIEELEKLARSIHISDRILAARILEDRGAANYHYILTQLIRDIEIPVKRAALTAAAGMNPHEFAPLCLEHLTSKNLYAYAYESLCEMGEEIVEYLEQAYYRTGVETLFVVRITNILGNIGSKMANEILVQKIPNQHIKVSTAALSNLRKNGYKVPEDQISKILQSANEIIGTTTWNLTAKYICEENFMSKELINALSDEIRMNYDYLFDLLSIIYDPISLMQIRENLDSGTSEGIGFAIELLDLFVAEELKTVLFPLLEDNSTIEKIKRLQNYFPIQLFTPSELLVALINRSSNQLSSWVKIWTMEEILLSDDFPVTDDLVAQLFNPDELMSETAATVMYIKDRKIYESAIKRINRTRKHELDVVNRSLKYKSTHLVKEKLTYFKSLNLFNNFPFLAVVEIAEKSGEITENNFHEFILSQDRSLYYYICLKGNINGINGSKRLITGKLIDGEYFRKINNASPTKDLTMYRIPKEVLYQVYFDYVEQRKLIGKILE